MTSSGPPGASDALVAALEESRDLGFLGPGPVQAHVRHAGGFLQAWAGRPPVSVVDLGSGGGVPALPLALAWPESHWLLVEANGRRARFLAQTLHRLGLEARVDVRAARAEVVGRDPAQRGRHDLVVARGFAAPAVTAECAAPFLAVGGRLLTSEPPEMRAWPEAALQLLGLAREGRRGPVMALRQAAACPDRFPRRNPGKRPLF